jgi:ribosomal protein S18 acetylase RimI-like enzyme
VTPASRIRIRSARQEDEKALAALDVISWTPQAGFPSVIERITTRGGFFTQDSPPQAHLVAVPEDGEAGAIVGYVRVTPPSPLPENAHVLLISGIAVHPDARRQGVAARLLEAAEAYAAERGARKLSLRVLGSNGPAIRLYEQAGYEREGTLREEFLIEGTYVDDVMMTKRLTS